jgi:Family of unknown function (DUF5958)
MTLDEEILLNQLAQGIRSMEAGNEWFAGLPVEQRLEVLRTLSHMALQAGARGEDVAPAIKRATLRASHTPCVLLLKGRLAGQLAKVLALPPPEYEKAFALLLALFAIADQRRRATQCADGCQHWWHQDLSQEQVVNDLRAGKVQAGR